MLQRRIYETTFIVNAALEDPDIESVVGKVVGYLENKSANMLEINKWGRRRLAYPINKKYNGFYVHLVFESEADVIPMFERFLVLDDTIMRHLTLKLSERLRDHRAKRALEGLSIHATLSQAKPEEVVETPVAVPVAEEIKQDNE